MFDKLVPWNILPERVVYVGNTQQLDKATANLKDATQRIRAQREHIARLERDYNDLVESYNRLMGNAQAFQAALVFFCDNGVTLDKESETRVAQFIMTIKEKRAKEKDYIPTLNDWIIAGCPVVVRRD